MGEAWFMGESRKMFDELLGDLDYIGTEQIQQVLVEIASGTSSFGEMDEWTDWFHYLMPRLLDRSHENFVDYTLENLITCFVALHPDENRVSGPYASFKEDALATLGNAMMESIRWDGDRVNLERALHSFGVAKTGYLMWQEVSGDLSASLFFRTKYLAPNDFDSWLASVLAIECPHWRSQLIVWFADAYPVLSGEIRFVSELDEGATVDWAWSHVLDGEYTGSDEDEKKVPFLADDSRPLKLEVTKYRLHDINLDSWLRSVEHTAYLHDAVESAAGRFAQLYL